MFEAIVVLASIGILVVEVIEFRDKCDQLPTAVRQRTPLGVPMELLDWGERN